MKTIYFSARDIRDYFTMLIDKTELKKIPDFPTDLLSCRTFTDSDGIKEILFDFIKAYKYRSALLEPPISVETDIAGLKLDFNFGLRLDIPKGNFHVRISDDDSGMIFFDEDLSDVRLVSVEKYFIRWRVDIFHDGKEIFSHTLDLNRKTVLLALMGDLSDTIALLPIVREFRQYHNCRPVISLPDNSLSELVARLYPEIPQVNRVVPKTYATYFLSLSMSNLLTAPFDYRNIPMNRMGSAILGLGIIPDKPIFNPTSRRLINEPYVCINVQSSENRKAWLYPGGWDIVVDYLKSLGYRVFCIDDTAEQTNNDLTIRKPEGAENFTGDFPIMEQANMLYHAEFFIGLSSGLTWLADAVNCPVVLICGFANNWYELFTPYRVSNRLVCGRCFNNLNVNFKKVKCPYYQNTDRELECQKKIHPQQVINAINQLIVDKNLTTPIMRSP